MEPSIVVSNIEKLFSSRQESHSALRHMLLLYVDGGGAISRLHECLSENSSLNDSNRLDSDICPDLSEVVTQFNMKNKNWQKMSKSQK